MKSREFPAYLTSTAGGGAGERAHGEALLSPTLLSPNPTQRKTQKFHHLPELISIYHLPVASRPRTPPPPP